MCKRSIPQDKLGSPFYTLSQDKVYNESEKAIHFNDLFFFSTVCTYPDIGYHRDRISACSGENWTYYK